MAIIHTSIDIPFTTITSVERGEGFVINFNLSTIFGKVVDTDDYTDCQIYLHYHKFGWNINLGQGLAATYWGIINGHITISGIDNDQAQITVNSSRTGGIRHGLWKYHIVLTGGLVEIESGECFNVKGRAVDTELFPGEGVGSEIIGSDFIIG